jgi:cell division septum initiation protein DivIVA
MEEIGAVHPGIQDEPSGIGQNACCPADHLGKVKRMPDQSSAASEHALIQEITAPLATMPDDPVSITADPHFPVAIRGYDRIAVDAYVKQTSQLVAELQATRSPEAAIRRALERVGEQISGILQRAHDTAEQITAQSRGEAEDRLEAARQEAARITAAAEQRLKDLDADTDRIWAERRQIVEDTRELAGQLLGLTDSAADRFPAAEDTSAVTEGGETADGTALADEPELTDERELSEPPEFAESGAAEDELPASGGDELPASGGEELSASGGDETEAPYDVDSDPGAELESADESPTAVIDREAIKDEPADADSTVVMPPTRPGEDPEQQS